MTVSPREARQWPAGEPDELGSRDGQTIDRRSNRMGLQLVDSAAAVSVEYAPSGVRLVPRPRLFELLGTAGRVVQVSAPAGSGKTFLLRSWIAEEGLADRTAWVSVGREEHDPQAFWLSVLYSLRQTDAGSERVRDLTAAPGPDGAALVERLLEDLGSLQEPAWLVIDDLHELQSPEALGQLGRLLEGAPPELRLVLLTRRDLRLGLHRLRVEGELTEIRGEDLRFSLQESGVLMGAAGVRLSEGALESVVAITEGWAAGLRLVALSLARHPDPEHYAAGFSGRERVVAEYLLAEVLERQPEDVSRLLLLTSVLEQVSGPLADRLIGASGSERILIELEDAGAFVVAVDPERTWFRYHHLFADLLALELRRTAPDELPRLHAAAAQWFAENGYPVEAIRHAQAAEDWGLAARLLADNWFGLYLDGRLATARELMSRFPAGRIAADPELALLAAGDKRIPGSLQEAEWFLDLAVRRAASVPENRRERFEIALAIKRLELARARNDLQGVANEAERLLASADAIESIEFGLGEDLRTSVLTELGIAEMSAGRLKDAERDLEQALAEARRIGRPKLELQALAHWALLSSSRSLVTAEQRAMEAMELARRHGWEETASAAIGCTVLGKVALWRGRLREAETWLDRAERVFEHIMRPTAMLTLYAGRALLERARGRHAEAAAAYREVERMEGLLVMPHMHATRQQAVHLEILVRTGETDRVEGALAKMDQELRETTEMRVVLASLRLAHGDPEAAVDVLAPILDDATTGSEASLWEIEAQLLEAIARDALRDPGAASRALERALDLAELGGALLPFVLYPSPELLERHSRSRTTHASLIAEIRVLLSGEAPAARPGDSEPLTEPLSESELRVLRYLPTNLHGSEIASELFVSLNTIRTHMRNVYLKLGVHSRADAVTRARDLGLLSPASLRR
jgi:LuxR family transcriptional regulator, maltose regulon positive regulatory protein